MPRDLVYWLAAWCVKSWLKFEIWIACLIFTLEGFITSTVKWRRFFPDLFASAVIILRFIFRYYKIGLWRCQKKFNVFTMLFTLPTSLAAKCGLILLTLLNGIKRMPSIQHFICFFTGCCCGLSFFVWEKRSQSATSTFHPAVLDG